MNNIIYLQIPDKCPVCGQAVHRVTSASGVESLFCSNDACPSKIINILDHYCCRSGMNIKGLSKATLEKLLEWGWIESIKDIYTLSEHRAEWIRKPGFGVASVDKILKAIDVSKSCELEKFLVALGIPLVGPQAAKEITKNFKNWTEFFNSISQKFKYYTLPNFGVEICRTILNFDYTDANYIACNYLDFKENEEIKTELAGLVFVITGSLTKPRKEYQSLIESLGGKVASNVSKNTNYLICNNKNINTNKIVQAKQLNIKIISEQEFYKIIN